MSTQPQAATRTPNKRSSKMASNQSLNHLLNFSLPPRQTQSAQSIPRRGRRSGAHQAVWNKERFLNAQYRFVVNPNGDYTVHFADPDIYFQWEDILQIIVPRISAIPVTANGDTAASQDEGHQACPICLSPPTAPRMTKCGHIFCFPCVLHLLNTSEQPKWARCPICFDSVTERHLKSVKWFDGPAQKDEEHDQPPAESSSSASMTSFDTSAPRPGSTLRMRLMQRPQITTLALPRSPTWPSDLLPSHQAPFHFLPDVYAYSKFMLATPNYLIEHLTKDIDDLTTERRTLIGMGDELGVLYVDAAMERVRNQVVKAGTLGTPQLDDAVEKAWRDWREIEERHARIAQRKKDQEQAGVTESTTDVPEAFLANQPIAFNAPAQRPSETPTSPTTPTTNRNPRQRRNINPPPPSTQTYYFYQAAFGLPVFLHPLDIRILLAHFHSYPEFPDTIDVLVDAYSAGSVNEDLRKRCKYLAHMPEGADVVFVEADLTGVVGEEGMRGFEGLVRTRKARRKEKEKKEDKAKAKAEEREKEATARLSSGWGAPVVHQVEYGQYEYEREVTPVVEEVVEPRPAPVVQSGAWGQRSFASAAGRPASERRGAAAPRREEVVEDDADWEAAWNELESGVGRGGRRKKNRLVVLGGGGGGGGVSRRR